MSLEEFSQWAIQYTPVGSRVTCNPPPTDTDEDYLALVSSEEEAFERLEALGFITTTDLGYEGIQSDFSSFKLGKLNIIVTESAEFNRRFLAASYVAKSLNLLKKVDRIMVFQAVLYGNKLGEKE